MVGPHRQCIPFVRNAYPTMCPDARVFHPWLTETSRHLKWLRSNSARTTRITTKESSFCPSDSEKGFAFPESERPSKLGFWRTCCERPQPIAHYHETAPPFSAHMSEPKQNNKCSNSGKITQKQPVDMHPQNSQ